MFSSRVSPACMRLDAELLVLPWSEAISRRTSFQST